MKEPMEKISCCDECKDSIGGDNTMLPLVRRCMNIDCLCHKSEPKEGEKLRQADIKELMQVQSGHHLGWTVLEKELLEGLEPGKEIRIKGFPKATMTKLGAEVCSKREKNFLPVKLFLKTDGQTLYVVGKTEKLIEEEQKLNIEKWKNIKLNIKL